MDQPFGGAGVSRRRVVVGAAWVTPAIIIASGVPAAAASDDPPDVSLSFDDILETGTPGVFAIPFTVDVTGPVNSYLATNATVSLTITRLDGDPPADVIVSTAVFEGTQNAVAWSALPSSSNGDFDPLVMTYAGANVVADGSISATVLVSGVIPGDIVNGTLSGNSGGGAVGYSEFRGIGLPGG